MAVRVVARLSPAQRPCGHGAGVPAALPTAFRAAPSPGTLRARTRVWRLGAMEKKKTPPCSRPAGLAAGLPGAAASPATPATAGTGLWRPWHARAARRRPRDVGAVHKTPPLARPDRRSGEPRGPARRGEHRTPFRPGVMGSWGPACRPWGEIFLPAFAPRPDVPTGVGVAVLARPRCSEDTGATFRVELVVRRRDGPRYTGPATL